MALTSGQDVPVDSGEIVAESAAALRDLRLWHTR
jgi:hypothetical protein